YFPVSQNLLNSILRDEDVAHVFNISPDEQEVVEHNGSCYVIGRSGTGKTTTMLFKMFGIERAWQKSGCPEPCPRQVFVTKSRMLARKVEEYFMQLIKSLLLADTVPDHVVDLMRRWEERDQAGMYDVEELDVWRTDLPAKFSELQDYHFPLFITFDELCSLVQEDIVPRDTRPARHVRRNNREGPWSSTYQDEMRLKKVITFEVFRTQYWPHLPQHLTKGLAPSLVFGEFIGVIKGSEMTLKAKDHVLTPEAYCPRSYATSSGMGDILYQLFQAYCKLKRKRDERDQADRTHEVLDAVKQKGLLGCKIDYLYVDEVQDNLLIDTLLLRSICRNSNGLFWAGDTAQTISVGSAFQFNELKAFLFRMEALWPSAIDILDRERGIVDGKKPLFVSILDASHLKSFFTSGSDTPIELGHNQCILVRDDAARARLKQEVGDIGVILTLYNSKGLEFDDVIIWNFFEDSTFETSRWRQLIVCVLGKESTTCPSFDESRLIGLSSEVCRAHQ
ncbi:hypothetical protein EVG20_g11606, partial [Dentipellis fragilis]